MKRQLMLPFWWCVERQWWTVMAPCACCMWGDATEIGKVADKARKTISNLLRWTYNWPNSQTSSERLVLPLPVSLSLFFFVKDVLLFFDFGSLNGWHEWLPVFERTLKYFMMAVTLIVVAVPEGLPMSVRSSLALNMRRMLLPTTWCGKCAARENNGSHHRDLYG